MGVDEFLYMYSISENVRRFKFLLMCFQEILKSHKKLYDLYLCSPSFGRVLAREPVKPTPRTGKPIAEIDERQVNQKTRTL